ncbi:hypothetical protein V1511DRAFT_451758, partial [Dipodascopsis uninucleata]
FNHSDDKDPDFDRSLPASASNITGAGITTKKNTKSSPALTSGTSFNLSGTGITNIGEEQSTTKQLYDPKTDPIAAIPKPPPENDASILQSKRFEEFGHLYSPGLNSSSTRWKKRRERRWKGDLGSGSGNINSHSGVRSSNDTGYSNNNINSHNNNVGNKAIAKSLQQSKGEVNPMIYSPEKDADVPVMQTRRRRRQIIDEFQARQESLTNVFTQRESGKIMLLTNSSVKDDSKESYVRELDHPRESVKDLERSIQDSYSRIGSLEAKIADMDNFNDRYKFEEDIWWESIRWYRRLLEEYEFFIFRCNSCDTSSSMRSLPRKCKMPIRMWKNCASEPFESLKKFLPDSSDIIIAYLYMVYKTFARLFELLQSDTEIWCEYLGDLCRYLMSIESEKEDRKKWQDMAFSWYIRCSRINPSVGRYYHQLALTTEPAILDQFYYFCKSLTTKPPYLQTIDSIIPLFDACFEMHVRDHDAIPFTFIRTHGILFMRSHLGELDDMLASFFRVVNRPGAWMVDGIKFAITNIACVLQYGAKNGIISRLIEFPNERRLESNTSDNSQMSLSDGTKSTTHPLSAQTSNSSTDSSSSFSSASAEGAVQLRSEKQKDVMSLFVADMNSALPHEIQESPEDVHATPIELFMLTDRFSTGLGMLSLARKIAFSTLKLALTVATPEHYSHIFAWLVFLDYMSKYQHASETLFLYGNFDENSDFPWDQLVRFLTTLTYLADVDKLYKAELFPCASPLCEDWALNGSYWADSFPWPNGFFKRDFEYDDIEIMRIKGDVGPQPRPANNQPARQPDRLLADSEKPFGAKKSEQQDQKRVDRILWTAFRLARVGPWFEYNKNTRQFTLVDQ